MVTFTERSMRTEFRQLLFKNTFPSKMSKCFIDDTLFPNANSEIRYPQNASPAIWWLWVHPECQGKHLHLFFSPDQT